MLFWIKVKDWHYVYLHIQFVQEFKIASIIMIYVCYLKDIAELIEENERLSQQMQVWMRAVSN